MSGDDTKQNIRHSGGCLCGAVRYEVVGPMRPVIACHCEQCRRTSGHHVAATSAPKSAIRIIDPESNLAFYQSSDAAERGFCKTCGSNLFWRRFEGDQMSIFAGTLDDATDLEMTHHIYADYKGGYYTIEGDIPVYGTEPE